MIISFVIIDKSIISYLTKIVHTLISLFDNASIRKEDKHEQSRCE